MVILVDTRAPKRLQFFCLTEANCDQTRQYVCVVGQELDHAHKDHDQVLCLQGPLYDAEVDHEYELLIHEIAIAQ